MPRRLAPTVTGRRRTVRWAGIDSHPPSTPSTVAWAFVAGLLTSCGVAAPPPVTPPPPKSTDVTTAPRDDDGTPGDAAVGDAAIEVEDTWASEVAFPRLAPAPDPALEPLLAACGRGEEALHVVARRIAVHRVETGVSPDGAMVDWWLRQAGSPSVRPRIWSARLDAPTRAPEDLLERVSRFGHGHVASEEDDHSPGRGERYCGIAEVETPDGGSVVAAVQVEGPAGLAPLALRHRVGDWIDVRTAFASPPLATNVVVLPPDGEPRSVTVRQADSRADARLTLDRAGPWLVQILAHREGGPLPELEVLLIAGDLDPAAPYERAAPGESTRLSEGDEAETLTRMLNEARARYGLPPLRRNADLDRVARTHSEAMMRAEGIRHDVGSGNPALRVAEAGIRARRVGENVARAPSIVRAHRVLWASPSHRGNVLFRHYDQVGIGLARTTEGQLFVTELFIDDD